MMRAYTTVRLGIRSPIRGHPIQKSDCEKGDRRKIWRKHRADHGGGRRGRRLGGWLLRGGEWDIGNLFG